MASKIRLPVKMVITGPECSGKTTLSKKIADHFHVKRNLEYARFYLNKLTGEYKKHDLLHIAKKQLISEIDCKILDTDLITIKIWSEYKYGDCHHWIKDQIVKQQNENRVYLLCKPDIKWEADKLREHPFSRNILYELYEKELNTLHHEYYVVDKNNPIKFYKKYLD